MAPGNIHLMEEKPPSGINLSVSIVSHDSPLELLERVLQTLHRSAVVAHAANSVDRVQVEVLDNSSNGVFRQSLSDLIAAWPAVDFFRVTFVRLLENRGFGAAHNVAIQGLNSDFHLVLNPDAELSDDALRVGLDRLRKDRNIVLLSPRVQGSDGAQQFLCKRYPSLVVLLLRAFAPSWVRQYFQGRLDYYEMRDVCSGSDDADVPLASGCFMLVRTAALQAVGGFNEKYFLYFEDFDLSIRLAEQGRLVFDPAIQIVHHGGFAARKGSLHLKLFLRSGLTFFRTHGWRWS
jgi:hypothetical protein